MDSVTGKANSTNTAQPDVLKLIKPLCLRSGRCRQDAP